MHIDARNLQNGSLIEGDICIIGAGAAGISMALQWINTPFKVILLEGGGFEVDEKIQEFYNGKNLGQRYYALQAVRLHYFGGTTGHWGGFCSTYDPIDFAKRDWVPHSGWPIQRKDLDPYYPKAQEILKIDKFEYNVDNWKKMDPSLIPLPMDKTIVWDKIWQFSPPARFAKEYKDVIVNAQNIHLYTYANVVNLGANENVSNISQVNIKNLEGKEHIVKAKYFVMACCAIQNSRLLLASNKQANHGIGNDHDLVGRYFMDHLEVKSADMLLPAAAPMKLYILDFYSTKARAELAISGKTQEEYKMLNGTSSLTPKEIAKSTVAWIDRFPDSAYKTVKMWEYYDKMGNSGMIPKVRDKAFQEFELFTRMEQAPNPLSRVTLDTEKDALGMPRANLNWQFTALEKSSIRKLYQIIGQQLGASGIGRVKMMDWLQDEQENSWPTFLGGGWHHMGTTRMNSDPKQGVVDANCKVHGVNNLYVAGSSCFATSGAANPTLTLLALTLRLSDHIKKKVESKSHASIS